MSQANRVSPDASGDVTTQAEHQVQMRLVRALENALQGGDRDGSAAEILGQLKVYTNAHFLGEQLLMRLHGYADYGKHCQEHDKLLETLSAVEAGFKAQPLDERLRRLKVFADNIAGHIAGSDDALERFVSSASGP